MHSIDVKHPDSSTLPKTLVYSLDEIANDYEAVMASINHACSRANGPYNISGICQTADMVYLPMEQRLSDQRIRYVIAPFSGVSNDNIKADILTRWSSGFATKGLIRLTDSSLGLFEIVDP